MLLYKGEIKESGLAYVKITFFSWTAPLHYDMYMTNVIGEDSGTADKSRHYTNHAIPNLART